MILQTLHSTKKTFYYNFFPSIAEDHSLKARKGPVGSAPDVGRVLIETRDIYPPLVLDPDNPWLLRKTLNHYEIACGKLVLTSNCTFDHMMANDDCVVSCMELVKDRKLKVDDEIGMYWDSKEADFKFKLWL
ncbi:UNVERIFIED_CONTAM: hypothetical protein Sangu_2814000 [Sesamum angustifolium]|uniref:Uncharacterized protein n=1 Tax=Sesamum angustifolium TaxID=2727405 RepID=A0AAW2IRD3_9LAMI